MFSVKKSVLLAAAALLILVPATSPLGGVSPEQNGKIQKNGFDVDIAAFFVAIGEEFATFEPTNLGASGDGGNRGTGGNTQVNDGTLDHIQVFPGARPYVFFTQSETSIAGHGNDLVAAYNTSAGVQAVQLPGGAVTFTRVPLSGFSHSPDGGRSWVSGFIPPVPGSIFTFGDPVVDTDRRGNFHYAGLGRDAQNRFTIQVNKSTDGGATWSDAVVVQQDDGGDKEWLAVGRDPVIRGRDNVYVTWTSFQPAPTGGSQLRFGRSIDGGATWTVKTIFAPRQNPNPALPQNAIQFSVPTVDPKTGTLYIPFLHFSNADQDFIRILISKDAGETFSFATFNVPGAPDPTVLPVTSAGELVDCGNGGFRLTIHAGPNIGGGRLGLRRFVRSARLVTQPAFAVRNGVLYLAWSNSTSSVFGDPTSGSNIKFTRSDDGGRTWTPVITANPTVAADVHHLLPSLDVSGNGDDDNENEGDDVGNDQGGNDEATNVHIGYYTQHTDGTIDLDLANSSNRGRSFPASRVVRVTSTSTTLAPTNIPLAGFATTNYDRVIAPCYNLGEYIGVKHEGDKVHVLWGDGRNLLTEPVHPLNPLSGQTHPQQDVFYKAFKKSDDK